MALYITVLVLLLLILPPQSSSFSVNNNGNANTQQNQRGSNRLFLDTAIESEWSSLMPLGIFHGITTNPTLLERAGHQCTIQSVQSLATRALSLSDDTDTGDDSSSSSSSNSYYCSEFMCQSWGSTSKEMYYNGMALSEVDRQKVVIKVPVTAEGTVAASKLIRDGVRVCLTACYASDQALVASAVGAEYIAPYLGRMEEQKNVDGVEECLRMQQIVNGMNSNGGSNGNSGATTRVLVASIRNVKSMTDLVARGNMDTFTFSPDIARKLFAEQMTIDAAADFEAAAQRCGGAAALK